MGFLRKFLRQMLDKGGVLTIGALCVMMCKKFKLPNPMGALAYGITAVGACGFTRYFFVEFDISSRDPEVEKFLSDLDKVKTVLAEGHHNTEELRDACERFMNMREVLEGLNRNMEEIQEMMVVLDLQKKTLINSELCSSVSTTKAEKQSDDACDDVGNLSEIKSVGPDRSPRDEIVPQQENPEDPIEENASTPRDIEVSGPSRAMVESDDGTMPQSAENTEERQEAASVLVQTVENQQGSPPDEETNSKEDTERVRREADTETELDTAVERE